MKNPGSYLLTIIAVAMLISTAACSQTAATPTATVALTDTPTATVTSTALPTTTVTPTATPTATVTPTATAVPTVFPGAWPVNLGLDIPVRIMPMGDSITEGVCDTSFNCIVPDVKTPIGGPGQKRSGLEACSWSLNPLNPKEVSYRAFLRDQLVAEGLQVTYVGSVEVMAGLAHEGHSAWAIRDLDYCVQNAGWLEKVQPHVILLQTGTNDASWNRTSDEMAADLSQLLEHIYAKLPPTTAVVVAQIIPASSHELTGFIESSNLLNDIIAPYNASIPKLVERFRAAGKNVSYVDMSGVIQSDDDFYDGVHPIPAAFERMAEVWLAKILEILGQPE